MTKAVTISIANDVLEAVDIRAKQMSIGRSECIEMFVRKGMNKPLEVDKLKEIYDGDGK